MMRRFLIWAVAALLASAASAQQIIPGLPPGAWANTAALGSAYQGVLDIVGSAIAYVGLDCSTRSYAGNVADINLYANPYTLEGTITCDGAGHLVFPANVGTASGGSGGNCTSITMCSVSKEYDQTGNGHDVTWATGAIRPYYHYSGQCGTYTGVCAKVFGHVTPAQYLVSSTGTGLGSYPTSMDAIAYMSSSPNGSTAIAQTVFSNVQSAATNTNGNQIEADVLTGGTTFIVRAIMANGLNTTNGNVGSGTATGAWHSLGGTWQVNGDATSGMTCSAADGCRTAFLDGTGGTTDVATSTVPPSVQNSIAVAVTNNSTFGQVFDGLEGAAVIYPSTLTATQHAAICHQWSLNHGMGLSC